MRLEINDDDFRALPKNTFRAAAYFLLAVIGDMDEDAVVPAGTNTAPPTPPLAPAAKATATGASNAGASAAANTSTMPPPPPTAPVHASNIPPPPPPPTDTNNGGEDDDEGGEPSNVVHGNFPQAGSSVPPPPTAGTADASAAPSSATTAAAAPGVVSVEVDSAGMQYDARIHQKAKGKKKNGEWKLIKGVDAALVQSVTAELAARKAATAPAPTAGSLPGGTNTVPVPPVPNATAAPNVPTQNGVGATVPVPPVPPVGSVGTSPYRALIDKITELTKANKLTPAKVMEVCQSHGAPSLMALNGMQHLVPLVDKDIDAAALGLL